MEGHCIESGLIFLTVTEPLQCYTCFGAFLKALVLSKLLVKPKIVLEYSSIFGETSRHNICVKHMSLCVCVVCVCVRVCACVCVCA